VARLTRTDAGPPHEVFMTLIRSAVAVLALWSALPALADDCGSGVVAELKLETVDSGSPVVIVTVNGSARRFLVEPGALWTAMSTPVAAKLGLKPLPLGPVGRSDLYSGGEEASQFAVAERLEFGGLAAQHAKVLLLPEKVVGPDLDGVLGSDLLANYDLDFDVAQHVLRLVSQRHCTGRVALWTQEYVAVPFSVSTSRHLVVPMTLDGKRVSVAIDTARIKTAMSESSADRLFGLTAKSPDVDVPADAQAAKALRFRMQFESLSLSGLTIRHPTVYVWADASERALAGGDADKGRTEPASGIELEHQDLAVGTDVLRHLHLYIAFAEKTLYASAADAH
jgi:predicted aspartyl protease